MTHYALDAAIEADRGQTVFLVYLSRFILALLVLSVLNGLRALYAVVARGRHTFNNALVAPAAVLFTCYLVSSVMMFYADSSINFVRSDAQSNMQRHRPVSERAAKLHAGLFVADLHADSLLWSGHRDLLDRHSFGHVDVPRLRESNVALQAFTIVTSYPMRAGLDNNDAPSLLGDAVTMLSVAQAWPVAAVASLHERAVQQCLALHDAARRSNGTLHVLRTRGELAAYRALRAKRGNEVVAGVLGIEGLHFVTNDAELARIGELYALGVRMIGLTHFFDNAVAGSAHGHTHAGLSELGRKALLEMARLGIAVDIAHASSQQISDILDFALAGGADAPPRITIVSSHTGFKEVCASQRNLDAEHMPRLRQAGALLGTGFFRPTICGDDDLDGIVANIEYTAREMGSYQHAALGSDFDGGVSTPFDVTGLVHITDALLKKGVSEADVRAVMGENTLRVFEKLLPE